MTTTTEEFVRDLRSIAQRRQNELATKISSGTLPSHEEYKMECGKIQGLSWLADMAFELLKNKSLADFDSGGGLPEMPPDEPPPNSKGPTRKAGSKGPRGAK